MERRERLTRLPWRPVAALLAGLALALAFPPVGLAVLAPVGVAGLTCVSLTSRLRGAIGWGLATGMVFFLVLIRWISLLGFDAWLGLSAYCALWMGLLGAAIWCVRRLPIWPLWVATIWILQEALRGRIPWGGFGWGRLAFSQAYAPDARYAALAGAPLVTFIVALSGSLLAWAVLTLARRRRMRTSGPKPTPVPPAFSTAPSGAAPSTTSHIPTVQREGGLPAPETGGKPSLTLHGRAGVNGWIGAAVAVVFSAVLWLGGLVIPLPTAGQSADGPSSATVAVVQGSVPQTGLNTVAQRRAVLDNHVAATMSLAEHVKQGTVKAPQLVVWPENSSDLDPFANADAAQLITQAANTIGVPILVGAVTRDPNIPNQVLNIGLVWNPGTGPGQVYVKRHPVPFGEFLPGRSLLTKVITRFERIPYDFSAGPVPGVLQVGPARLGDVICFEVSDDALVRDATVAGGRALTVQTNNATFSFRGLGGSAQPEQQAAMSTLRAIEHGRTMIVAATSGVSTIIGPDGSTIERAPLFAQAELVADIPLRDSLTLADRVGAWPEWVLVGFAVLAIILGLVTSRGKPSGSGANAAWHPARVEPPVDPEGPS